MKKFYRDHVLAILFALSIALTGTVALAQSTGADNNQGSKHGWHGMGGEGFHHGHGERMMHAFMDKLDLTDAQKAQIKQIHESHHDAILPVMKELRAKEQEI